MRKLLFFSLLILSSVTLFAGQPEASSTVDAILAKSWKEKGVTPAAKIDDETFVRRIYLDAIGRIPTAAVYREFMARESSTKRSDLIDELLDSEGYVNHQFNFWADILRIHSNQGGGQNVVPSYIGFVKSALRENKPYDQFVRELVTAEGKTYANGAIGYYYRDRGMPLDNMANTVRIFLGTRLECAQCHNHPFDKWTQMDFFHMAAFSYGMNIQNNGGGDKIQSLLKEMNSNKTMDRDEKRSFQKALQEIRRPVRNSPTVAFNAEKRPQLPHDYQYGDGKPREAITEKVMFGTAPEISSPGEKLHRYADWMTSPDNPRFTKVIVNRLWKQVMGLGLVEPVDEFVDSTAAANPELFEFLEAEMKANQYDVKAMLRLLYNTDVYQREAYSGEVLVPADYAFTGPVMRRMTAEQIWDTIVTMVNPKPELGNWKAEQEAILRDAGAQMMIDALNQKNKDQLMADVKLIAGFQKKLEITLREVQKQQVEARQNKDQKLVRELAQRSNKVRQDLSKKVYTEVYAPVLQHKGTETVAFVTPDGMGDFEMQISPDQLDQNGRLKQEVRNEISKKENELFKHEMDEMGMTDGKMRRNYLGFRKNIATNFARAANLKSPADAGHFLRQFGQSDRETIENSESAASVTQALTMLNGPIFRTVVNPQSVLSRELQKAATADEKIELIYLSILCRQPEAEEVSLILHDAEKRGDQLYQDLVFALMNTQEFYFIR